MTVHVRLRLLGPFQIEREGQPVSGLSLGKRLAVLGYLVARGEPLSRVHLADLFWRGLPEGRGRANLSWMLNKLSVALPCCLEADRHTVSFAPVDGCWIDLSVFQELAAASDADSLAAAAALYRGDFLQGLLLNDCADFELWLVAERERWRGRAERALGALVAHHRERGRAAQALGYARRLLALAPWREEAHRQVMRLLVETGQRGPALAQYEACRRALEVELGVGPAAETVALYERIRAGELGPKIYSSTTAPEIAPASTPRHNLPAAVTPFIGREPQLAEVRELLTRPQVRLLTLTGVGGTGKTRLALQVAAGLLDDVSSPFPDGVFFVPLASLRDPALVLPAIARVLGVRESTVDALDAAQDPPLVASLSYALRDRQLLLLVDNFEHVVDAAPAVGKLLAGAPGLKVLTTSRAPLQVYAEHVYPVPPMATPGDRKEGERRTGGTSEGQGLPLEELARVETVRLFVQRAQRVRPGFYLTEKNAQAVSEICTRLDGLPLAIELAAARVRLLSPEAILPHLNDRLRFLTGGPGDLPARQRTLRAALEWSYDLLEPGARILFSRLAVFAGGFGLEAVEAVCQGANDDSTSSLERLQSLVDHNLVQAHRVSDPMRFMMLETVREHALAQLIAGNDTQAVRDRHAAHYVAALGAWAKDAKGPRQLKALREIEADLDNARAAWDWAVERGRVDWLDQALEGLCLIYDWCGRYREGAAACQRAAESLECAADDGMPDPLCAPEPGYRDRCRVLLTVLAWQGRFTRVVGSGELADRCFERVQLGLAVPDQLATNDSAVQRTRAFVLLQLAARVSYADLERGKRLAERGYAIYEALGDRWGMADALNRLGGIAWRQGAYGEMEQQLAQSLALSRALGDRRTMPRALAGLGIAATNLGRPEEAERLARDGLAISREFADSEAIRMLDVVLCAAYEDRGMFLQAQSVREASLAVQREGEDRRAEIGDMVYLGLIKVHLGAYDEARSLAQAAMPLCREAGQWQEQGACCRLLGVLALAAGKYGEAGMWSEKSADIFEQIGTLTNQGRALVELAFAERGLGRSTQAWKHAYEALEIADRTKRRDLVVTALSAVALLLIDSDAMEKGVELYALTSRYAYVVNSCWFEDVAGAHIAAAAETLPPEAVRAAQQRGLDRDLWETTQELLAEFSQQTHHCAQDNS